MNQQLIQDFSTFRQVGWPTLFATDSPDLSSDGWKQTMPALRLRNADADISILCPVVSHNQMRKYIKVPVTQTSTCI